MQITASTATDIYHIWGRRIKERKQLNIWRSTLLLVISVK